MQGIVQRIVQGHFADYARHRRLRPEVRRAAHQIATCRTREQGFHIWSCPNGDFQREQANSCKHRSCPLCGASETERWVQAQQASALPCRYHQIVFTLPDSLHPLWRYNRRAFTNLLFRAAWESLHTFFRDPHWLGAEPGLIAVCQSWGETLNTHLHLHVLVTAGGLTPAGAWVAPKKDFLFPARALSIVFRGCLRKQLLAALDDWSLPPDQTPARCRMLLNRLGRQRWHVQIEPPYAHPRGVILYLARYLRRGPIAERRIQHYDGHCLRIGYKRRDEHAGATFQLSAEEFLRRLFTHVPPKGLKLVRAYGLFHHRRRAQRELARTELLARLVPTDSGPVNGSRADAPPVHRAGPCCPHCGVALRVTLWIYPSRAPPQRVAA